MPRRDLYQKPGEQPYREVAACWNPATKELDLTVKVSVSSLIALKQGGYHTDFAEARNLPTALRRPSSVYRALDDDLLFFCPLEAVPYASPNHRGDPRPQVFYVRVRPSEGHLVKLWMFERASEAEPGTPHSLEARIKERLK